MEKNLKQTPNLTKQQILLTFNGKFEYFPLKSQKRINGWKMPSYAKFLENKSKHNLNLST